MCTRAKGQPLMYSFLSQGVGMEPVKALASFSPDQRWSFLPCPSLPPLWLTRFPVSFSSCLLLSRRSALVPVIAALEGREEIAWSNLRRNRSQQGQGIQGECPESQALAWSSSLKLYSHQGPQCPWTFRCLSLLGGLSDRGEEKGRNP